MMLATETKAAKVAGKTISQDFSITNHALVINYLTKNIYSNPIGSICRELMSNARDAHIEMDKATTPIVVRIPNAMNSNWEVQDFGPGISPERMEKVFTKYGESTKRTDNKQTGGFGIGAKTGWAYTDMFTIRTVAEEDGKRVLRTYAAIKEGDAAPRLVEMGEGEETQETTGTTISIPVNPKDFDAFLRETFFVTQFWSTRPEIRGNGDRNLWETYTWHYEGTNWKIGDSTRHYSSAFVTVDGIPYPVNHNDLVEFNREDWYDLLRKNLIMEFNVGALTLSLNREMLQYDSKTKGAIAERCRIILESLKKDASQKIQAAKSLWEAHTLYQNLMQVFDIRALVSGKIEWNGIEIDGDPLGNANSIINVSRVETTRSGKMKLSRAWSYRPDSDAVFFINDTNELDRVVYRRIRTIMQNYPNKNIVIITEHTTHSKFAEIAGKTHWDLIRPSLKLLTSVTPMPIIRSPSVRKAKGLPTMIDAQKWMSNGFYQESQVDISTLTGTFFVTHVRHATNIGYDVLRNLCNLGIIDPTKLVSIKNKDCDKAIKNGMQFLTTSKVIQMINTYMANNPAIIQEIQTHTSYNTTFTFYHHIGSTLSDIVEKHKDMFDPATTFGAWVHESINHVKNKPNTSPSQNASNLHHLIMNFNISLPNTTTSQSLEETFKKIDTNFINFAHRCLDNYNSDTPEYLPFVLKALQATAP